MAFVVCGLYCVFDQFLTFLDGFYDFIVDYGRQHAEE